MAVPVATAYEKWTQFEDFPKFMHRVVSVEQKDDDRIAWQEKIWFSKRQWEAEILEKRKNDRIAWKTVQGTSHTGVISFHKLDDKLTRVMVTLDFHPSGMIEKMASGLRFAKRAVQADLARFKAYVEIGRDRGRRVHARGHDRRRRRDDEGDNGDGGGAQASSNGSGDASELDERSKEEREESRQERAERRGQRKS